MGALERAEDRVRKRQKQKGKSKKAEGQRRRPEAKAALVGGWKSGETRGAWQI